MKLKQKHKNLAQQSAIKNPEIQLMPKGTEKTDTDSYVDSNFFKFLAKQTNGQKIIMKEN